MPEHRTRARTARRKAESAPVVSRHKTFSVDLGEDVATGINPNGVIVFSFDVKDPATVKRVLKALEDLKVNIAIAQYRPENRDK